MPEYNDLKLNFRDKIRKDSSSKCASFSTRSMISSRRNRDSASRFLKIANLINRIERRVSNIA